MYGHWQQQMIHHPHFNQSIVPVILSTHPTEWTKDNVWMWLKWCSEEYAIENIPPDKFNMNGKAICLLSRDDFKERWPKNGDVLYNALQRLSQKSNTASQSLSPFAGLLPQPVAAVSHQSVNSHEHNNIGPYLVLSNLDSQRFSPPRPRTYKPILPQPPKSPLMVNQLPEASQPTHIPEILSPAPSVEMESNQSDTDSTLESEETSTANTHWPDCKQRIIFDDVGNRKHGTDCRLLWEFIYQLLQCPDIYKDFLCWDNKPELIFRIVNPTGLAELWGQQKNRTNMTYEKLSRALRYYYRMNIIKKVHGKRLTYRFMQQPELIQKGQRGARPHTRFSTTDGPTGNVPGVIKCCETDSNEPKVASPSNMEALTESTNQQLRNYLCSKKMTLLSEDLEHTRIAKKEPVDSLFPNDTVQIDCKPCNDDQKFNHIGNSSRTSPFNSNYNAPLHYPSTLDTVKTEIQSEPEDLSMSTLHKRRTSCELEPSVNTNYLNNVYMQKLSPHVGNTFEKTNS